MKVYDIVKKIPYGKVASYGQIAEYCQFPGRARQVGYALAALAKQTTTDVPWHRVVNAKGEISMPSKTKQQNLLEKEGISFKNNKIDLKNFGWKC